MDEVAAEHFVIVGVGVIGGCAVGWPGQGLSLASVGWVLAAVGARAPPTNLRPLSSALSPSTRINVPRKGGRVERPPRRTWALQQNRQG
jgi:hypothetical protein